MVINTSDLAWALSMVGGFLVAVAGIAALIVWIGRRRSPTLVIDWTLALSAVVTLLALVAIPVAVVRTLTAPELAIELVDARAQAGFIAGHPLPVFTPQASGVVINMTQNEIANLPLVHAFDAFHEMRCITGLKIDQKGLLPLCLSGTFQYALAAGYIHRDWFRQPDMFALRHRIFDLSGMEVGRAGNGYRIHTRVNQILISINPNKTFIIAYVKGILDMINPISKRILQSGNVKVVFTMLSHHPGNVMSSAATAKYADMDFCIGVCRKYSLGFQYHQTGRSNGGALHEASARAAVHFHTILLNQVRL